MDFNVAAQQIGVGYSIFPIEAFSYLFGTVPEIKANLEGDSGSWPFFLNAAGENLKGLTEMRSGGDRPNFDNAWDFWNFPAALGGPGDFLFELGTLGNMIARSPGIAVDNSDVVYQFDTDPALSPDEVAFNSSVFLEQKERALEQQETRQEQLTQLVDRLDKSIFSIIQEIRSITYNDSISDYEKILYIKQSLKSTSPDEIQAIRREADTNAKETRVELEQKLSNITKGISDYQRSSNQSITQQFAESKKAITDVTKALSEIKGTNEQVLSFANQMKTLEKILGNSKQRGILGEIQLENLLFKLKKIGIEAKVTDRAISEIGKAGFDPIYGARPLKRAIQNEIENKLSTEILSGKFLDKDILEIDFNNGSFLFNKLDHAKV